MNLTPLMAASVAGNVPLVEILLARGANPAATDHLGRNALHWAMLKAFREAQYARGAFAAIYELIAPAGIDLMVGERLVRIDRHATEYFLFQTLWVLFKGRFASDEWYVYEPAAFETRTILDAWRQLPTHVLKPERNKRQHLSNVLSRNEVDRDYTYNRRLFKRIRQGWYQLNPALFIRRSDVKDGAWLPLLEALNLELVKECADDSHWLEIDELLASVGITPAGNPLRIVKTDLTA